MKWKQLSHFEVAPLRALPLVQQGSMIFIHYFCPGQDPSQQNTSFRHNTTYCLKFVRVALALLADPAEGALDDAVALLPGDVEDGRRPPVVRVQLDERLLRAHVVSASKEGEKVAVLITKWSVSHQDSAKVL